MANPYIQQSPMVVPEQAQIARQQKLAELLQQQAAAPIEANQVVGGRVVPVSWAQGAAKLLQGWGAGRAADRADEMTRQYAEGQKQKRLGTISQIQADPSRMAQILMESEDPALQQMGLTEALKRSGGNADKFGKINPHDYTPESIKAFSTSGDFSALVPVRKHEVAPSGVVFNPYEVKPGTVFSDPNKLVSIGPDGQPVINQTALDAKSRVARAGASKITVNTGAKAFEQELGKLDAKTLDEMRGKAQAATETLGLVENMRGAIKQGVYSGGGAQAKTAAASMIAGITGVTPKGLPGSETFNAEASKLVLERIKTLGANPSNADREFIEKTVPTLSTSPQARDQLISFLEKKAKDAIELHRSADAYARKNHGLGGWSGVVQPAGTAQPTANRNVTVDY